MTVDEYVAGPPTIRDRRRRHPTLGRPLQRAAGTSRWSSCCATWRRTASPPSSPRAATATSCGRSPTTSTAIPPERVIGSSNALRYDGRRPAADRLPGRARRVRRRPGQAGADLEPHRPAADPRRRQLQRRHPDAARSPAGRDARRCGCWSTTTTPSGSSTTPPAPRHALRRAARRGLDRRQRQGRLGHASIRRDGDRGAGRSRSRRGCAATTGPGWPRTSSAGWPPAPSSSPRRWRTPPSPTCRRRSGCTRAWCRWPCTPCSAGRGRCRSAPPRRRHPHRLDPARRRRRRRQRRPGPGPGHADAARRRDPARRPGAAARQRSIDNISEATLTGIKVGVGLTVAAGQLPKLLGIPGDPDRRQLLRRAAGRASTTSATSAGRRSPSRRSPSPCCSACDGSRPRSPARWSPWSAASCWSRSPSIDEHGVALIAPVPSGLPTPVVPVPRPRRAAAARRVRHRHHGVPRDRSPSAGAVRRQSEPPIDNDQELVASGLSCARRGVLPGHAVGRRVLPDRDQPARGRPHPAQRAGHRRPGDRLRPLPRRRSSATSRRRPWAAWSSSPCSG